MEDKEIWWPEVEKIPWKNQNGFQRKSIHDFSDSDYSSHHRRSEHKQKIFCLQIQQNI